LERALKNIETLKEFAEKEFAHVKDEFRGINEHFVTNFRFYDFEKNNKESTDRHSTQLQSIISSFEDVHNRLRKLERKTDEDIPF